MSDCEILIVHEADTRIDVYIEHKFTYDTLDHGCWEVVGDIV
jgi:hypothetical protein